MGGILGLVGLGRVRLSLNMARRPRSLGGLNGSPGSLLFSLVARMEDCDTPVLGALAIRFAAFGVVFCKIGLLIVGLAGTVGGGLLDCLSGSLVVIKEGLSDDDNDDDGDKLDTDEGDVILVTVALDSLCFIGAGAAGEDSDEDDDDSEGSLLEIVVAEEEEEAGG